MAAAAVAGNGSVRPEAQPTTGKTKALDYGNRGELFGKGRRTLEAVPPGCECPDCKEWRMDELVWIDDQEVGCESCGAIYNPTTGRIVGSIGDSCPECTEERPARLAFSADGRVTCKTCGTIYNPATGEVRRRGRGRSKGRRDAGDESAG